MADNQNWIASCTLPTGEDGFRFVVDSREMASSFAEGFKEDGFTNIRVKKVKHAHRT